MTSADLPAAWWGLDKQVATSWLDDCVPSMGAALAYYTMFSLAPLLLLVGATTVFAELQDALDRIWRVPGRLRKGGWLTLVRARLMAFGMILAVGFLLIVSLAASAMLAAVSRRLDPFFGGWRAVVEAGNAVGGFVLVAIMFGLIYRVMARQPGCTFQRRSCWWAPSSPASTPGPSDPRRPRRLMAGAGVRTSQGSTERDHSEGATT